MQRSTNLARLALGVEAAGDPQRFRIRFQHGVNLGIERRDPREIRRANRLCRACPAPHRVLQLRDGHLLEIVLPP